MPATTTRRTVVRTIALLAIGCGRAGAPAAASDSGATSGFFPGAGAQLHYELDLPPGPGPFPAVVMGHGSGRSTKEQTRFLAPFWNSRGFAVLRYDRRGVGQSTGTYVPLGPNNSEVGVPELAGDMVAGVQFLKARSDIRGSRIGLMGISQAGWIMVGAAELSTDVAFVVAAVGSTMPVAVNVVYENLRTLPIDEAYVQLGAYAGAQGWDPLPRLARLRIPGLWLMGDVDRLVPTRIAAPRLRSIPGRYTVHIYSGGHEVGGAIGTWESDLSSWLQREGLLP